MVGDPGEIEQRDPWQQTDRGVDVAGQSEVEVDAVVHSCKDLPTAAFPGVDLVALPKREDPRDVLVTAGGYGLADLPPGARVGTGSPRRRAQLLRVRPDLDVVDIRGKVDTRLARVLAPGSDRLDAVVLASAGLGRLGRTDVPGTPLDLADWPTAPAQGVLAVEIRSDAPEEVRAELAALDHPATRFAATLEREVLRGLEAGCAAPLGVSVHDGQVIAQAYALDGAASVRVQRPVEPSRGSASEQAESIVAELLDGGAAELLR